MKPLRKLLALFRKEKLDREMSEEMRHHLELAAQENLARGLPAADAAPAAQRSFGHIEGYKEEIREQRGLPWLEHILQDFGYGFRLLRKSPGFTAVTVLTLALGIGATAAIFTVVNSVILQPLPYRDSARVVGLGESFKGQPPNNSSARVTVREWMAQATSFETIGAAGGWPRTFTGLGLPIRIYGWRVTAGYFPTLGVQPVLGRNFRPEEFVVGKGNVLILNHRLWVSSFDRRPDIIGQQVRIDDQPYTIIGVMPPNLWPEPIKDPEFFAPEPESVSDVGLWPRYWDVVARLKPGVTIAQADREIAEISRRTALKFPDTNKDWSGHAVPAIDFKVGTIKPLLFLLLGAVGFLLLISCVNVANLLLARASTRAKEIAVRIALGASRRRIVSQLLCESLLVSAAGSVLGIVLAYAGLQLLAGSAPLSMPRAHEIAIDGWVLAFSCALAACTGLGFGLAPALQASRINPQQAMRDHGRGNTGTSGALKLRSVLVAFEVSLALVLLMVAGLLIHSFLRLQQVPLGFQTTTCYLAKIILPASRYPTAQSQNLFATQVTERLTAVPGVRSVVFASHFPGFSGNDRPFRVDSRPDLDPANLPVASTYVTTPALFDALNMRLVQGRLLETRDTADRAPVAVVSRSFAAKFFPGQNPLGQRVTAMSDVHDASSREIVGVVDDIHDRGPMVERPYQIYVPYAQSTFPVPNLLIRVDGPIMGLEHSLREAMDRVDSEMPLTIVTKLDLTAFMNELIAPQRYALFVFGAFAGVALLLSALGIYGVVAYSVAQRTQEIGIRMALGAQPRAILALILSQTGRMVGAGVVIGLVASFVATRYLGSLLFEIGAHDPVAFAAVPLFLALVALLACWLPARRATQVNPIIALRSE